ncbi:MAG: GNAT family N-acetyltransferase [Oscillospiraceae bacterium]|jgi:RimJ/RimL family protein N-acetyltransferase|nr:GNAT family N-acetyltransferase [Oscillospiraceae bacterium]
MGHIIGEHIVLREYRQEDLPAIRAWANDAEATHYLSHIFLPPQTLPMTEDFLQRMLNSPFNEYHFIIADKETLDYIGQVDLLNTNALNRTAELGVVIGAAQKRGCGVGTEAITLLLRYAFLQANLNRIDIWVNAENARAIRCYEKCGFVHEGARRQAHFADGGYHDLLLMGALRQEWLTARNL